MSQESRQRLEPSAAQVERRGHWRTARAAYNTLLYQVRANLVQRAAQRTFDIAGADLPPARHGAGSALERLLRASRERWLPWHEQVPYLPRDRSTPRGGGAGPWGTAAARFPRYRTRHGPGWMTP